jgi:hypothetical protein
MDKPVDSALDKNKSKFGIFVLLALLKMLADGNSLLDQHVEILRNFWG